MTLSVETLGQDNIKTLQNAVANLAKEGGDAAPEFQQLADEIGRIGEQAQAIAAFKDLAMQTDALATKQQEAAAKVGELAGKLQLAGQATDAAAAKQRAASAALLEARQIYDGATSGIKNLNAEYDAAGRKTDDYRGKLITLTQQQGEQRDKFAELRSELKQANAALSETEGAQSKLTTQHTRADAALAKVTTALHAHNGAVTESAQAAEKLGTSTENLATSEAQLLQALNASRTAALARAAAMDQVKQADTQAKAAVDSIANAFRTVGVKSAQELEAEIVQVRLAMDELKNKAGLTGSTLSTAFAAGESKINGLERQIREVNGTLTMGDNAAKLFSNSLGQISAGNIIADGVGYLVNKVKELGQAFLGAIVQGDQLTRGLNAVYKDAAITAQQIDFLRKASSESGVAFGSLSGEFVKFTASMKMANIPMAQSNDLFRAVTAASASLGLGAEATAGTLNALGQMASKGTVSLEELRAQLGDRLPGALGLTAQGLGITEGQLIKLVESGQLATRDFVVPFTQALGQLKGEVDGLVPSWERLKGTMTQVAQGVGDSGWTQVLNLGIKVLGGTVGVFALGLSGLSEALFLVVKGVAALALAVTSPKAAMELMSDAVEAARVRLTGQADALNNLIEPSAAAAAATATHAGAITANTAAVTKSIAANTQLDTAQKLAALSTALAADTTLDAAAKIVQYNVAAAELLKSQSGQTDAFNKLAKAAKDQGATLVENAKLTGNNTAVQTAGLQAAQLYAAAIDKATASQALETAALIAQKAELEKSAIGRTGGAAAIKAQVDALDALILKSKAETEQAIQNQATARTEVESRKLAVAALSDNSSKVDFYTKAVASAQAEVNRLTVMEAAGIDVKEPLAVAQGKLASSTYLRRDALTDLISKEELATKVQGASLQLSIAQSDASGKHYLALAAEARALGDTALATHYEVQAKEAQIKTMQLKLQLDKLQQDAALLEIGLKRKLIDGNTEEGKVKLQLLDIETQMIKIKQVGNQAAQDAIRAVEKETDALRTGTSVRKQSTDGINIDTGARNVNTGAINAQASAVEQLAAAQKKADDDWKKGSEAANQTKAAPGRVDLSLAQKILDATNTGQTVSMTASEYAQAKEQAKTASDAVQTGLQNSPGLVSSDAMAQAAAMLRAVMNISSVNITDKPATTTTGTQQQTTTHAKTYTVNINLGGTNTAINTSSDADAQALISLLQRAKLSA